MKSSVRLPYAAGNFYPSDRGELISLLEKMDSEARNSRQAVSGEVKGLIVPHAGYVFSGKTAMAGYLTLKNKQLEHLILIGPNHNSEPHRTSVYNSGNWETPIGDVEIDTTLSDRISDTDRLFQPDNEAHAKEHSLEVQLPFLQYTLNGNFRITPILMGNQERKTAIGIARKLYEMNLEIPLIVSTDLNHYESLDTTIRKDSLLIDSITSLDTGRLYRILEKEKVSACGYGPIAVLMEYTRMMGGRIDLIDHSTSFHYSRDTKRVVGYASLAATY